MENPRLPGAPFGGPRRVFTAPVSTSVPRSTSSTRSGDGLVETLYNHPFAKIVAFTAGSRPVPLNPVRGIASPIEVEPGTLSWSSRLERTIAVGTFRIYRAPGSVAFLNCGSALQPILPKSQCWCVDEESSKYVLQIRRPQYWRIEIPVDSAEDIHQAQLLREVLGKILQFEKTECPFKRTFKVELPEQPQTPVKKRPWTPVRRSVVSLPPTPVTPIESRPLLRSQEEAPAQEGNISALTREEKGDPSQAAETEAHSKTGLGQTPVMEALLARDAQDIQKAVADAESPVVEELPLLQDIREPSPSVEVITDSFEKLAAKNPTQVKLGSFQASRSATAPPQLTLVTSPPSTVVATEIHEVAVGEPGQRSQSPTPSQESFHSVPSWHSPTASLPPSPPLSDPDSPLTFPYPHHNVLRSNNKMVHQRVTSEATATPETPQTWRHGSAGLTTPLAPAAAAAPQPVDDVVEVSSAGSVATAEEEPLVSPPLPKLEAAPVAPSAATSASSTEVTRRPQIRHRATTSSSISPNRRALSPLPPAANLFTPHQPASLVARRKLAVVRRLPMAVIQKTCEILLSPPSHLINLMLKVAARITAGEWRGFVFGTGESGESIPVQWDWSDADDDAQSELDGWGADDDWPHRGMGKKMAGSFPEDDEGSPVDGAGTSSTKDREAFDEDWGRNLGVD